MDNIQRSMNLTSCKIALFYISRFFSCYPWPEMLCSEGVLGYLEDPNSLFSLSSTDCFNPPTSTWFLQSPSLFAWQILLHLLSLNLDITSSREAFLAYSDWSLGIRTFVPIPQTHHSWRIVYSIPSA